MMKTVLPLLALFIFMANLHAAETKEQIEIALKISGTGISGGQLNSEPKITILNGQKSTIRAVREWRQPAPADGGFAARRMDVGLIFEMQASFSGGKVVYSGLATVREFKGAKLNSADGQPLPEHPISAAPANPENATSYFETLEIVLAGTAKPNTPVIAKFDNGLTVSVIFTILNPDGSRKKL